MVSPTLQRLLDKPLNEHDRINKIWLPEGKKPDSRTEDQRSLQSAMTRLKMSNNKRHDQEKREALLDYYASTDVPVERVAKHLKMRLSETRRALRNRGRTL